VRVFQCLHGRINHEEEEIVMSALETVRKIKKSIGRAATKPQVEFTCRAPEAKKVCIAGTFNDWNTKSMPMKKGKDGTWRIMVKLSPRYEYKYFVDGTWAQDIPGAELASNPFGTNNCVIGVK
jgi:1,4-alpha-glucan branching enzyme